MRKILLMILSITTIIGLAACGEKIDDETADKYVSKAEEVVSLLNDKQYDDLRAMFDATMKEELTDTELKQLAPYIEEAGHFETIDKSSVERDDPYYVVILSVKYSNDTLIYTISFNENDEVSGLFVQ